MTPGARVQAAIEALDEILAGAPAERVLTSWARRSRFAGSKDRAAVRDLVFSGLRQRNSLAARGGSMTGRGIMLGYVAASGDEVTDLFSGQGHAPTAPTEAEQAALAADPDPEVIDLPDWIVPMFRARLGEDFDAVLRLMADRAPVHLRVNPRKASRDTAMAALAQDGIETVPHPAADTALVVVGDGRKVAQSDPYVSGLIELQDASSQAAIAALPLTDGDRVLDYCAGGGGKVLAMAARVEGRFFAHDIDAGRMRDLPPRGQRAGVGIRMIEPGQAARHAPFDLVFCDAPCSGSGTWRRSPDAKWRFGETDLAALQATQAAILDAAAPLVGAGGHLAYATCSLLRAENEDVIDAFLARNAGWQVTGMQQWTPIDDTDGFFLTVMTRSQGA
ncbi:RsmB/NOP family class I SAM-dependent RNA methyltransferase [Shimia biformata]|uniref:RsmB/NOP family class I SAM-dependent RNA methyltransferase n=1 Tax=Shimia biformata TaxID=1294299 RepID=UPI00194F4FAD|nr:RsmB/NOP family class I SAM-dependent RNA methyltransferase [Shimia biformata]